MKDEKKELMDENFRDLANAIVLQAVADYRDAILYNDPKIERRCERFFRSQWCNLLTRVRRDYLAEKIKNETLEFKFKAGKIFDRKERENDHNSETDAFKCPTCGAAVGVSFDWISKKDKSRGYVACCKSCGLTYKRKLGGEEIHRTLYYNF